MKKSFKIVLIVLLVLIIGAGAFVHISLYNFHITKIEDYLYAIDCGHVSEAVADRIVGRLDVDVEVACASVRKGDLHARNFDWYYSEEAEFVVRCGGHGEKYASIGVASLSGIENGFAEKGLYTPLYHFLQLYTVDGINETGLVVNTNIVPEGDVGSTVGTNPGGMRLCSAIIPRYLLDNAGSVEEAVALLQAADIYSYQDEEGPFELHFMISDPEKTAVVEFIDNKMIVLYDENIMTNFYLSLDDYTEHAMGIERYEILVDGYGAVTDESSMLDLMKEVWYSRSYTQTDPAWLSEDYGTVYNEKGEVFGRSSDLEDFRKVLEEEQARFIGRTRDGTTWQTVHTSLFNLEDRSLKVIAQENGELFTFSLRK